MYHEFRKKINPQLYLSSLLTVEYSGNRNWIRHMEWSLGVLGRVRSWTWWPSWVPTTQVILWLRDSDSFSLVISFQWPPKYNVTNTPPFLSLSEEYEQSCKADLWDKDTVDVFWPGPCILRDYSLQDTNCPLHYGLHAVLYSFKLQHLLLQLFVDLPLSLLCSFPCSSQSDLQVALKFAFLILIALCLLCKCFCQVLLPAHIHILPSVLSQLRTTIQPLHKLTHLENSVMQYIAHNSSSVSSVLLFRQLSYIHVTLLRSTHLKRVNNFSVTSNEIIR